MGLSENLCCALPSRLLHKSKLTVDDVPTCVPDIVPMDSHIYFVHSLVGFFGLQKFLIIRTHHP